MLCQLNFVEMALCEVFYQLAMEISGTGKTLSLLCATLAWISKQKEIRRKWTSNLLDESDHDDDEMEEGEKAAASDKENKNDEPSDSNKMHEDSSELPTNNKTDEDIPMDEIKVYYALRTHSQITQGK